MSVNEATARIKINNLLEKAGWRFFPEYGKPANISLERHTTITRSILDGLGDDFEKTASGFIDFMLLDDTGAPLAVLEAKSSRINPLSAKEQARDYAISQNCRFVILSNGDLHYLWDIGRGDPKQITSFPAPDSITEHVYHEPADPQRLVGEPVDRDYIVLSQRPGYKREAAWRNPHERQDFINTHKLRFLRPYQLEAIHTLQRAVKKGNDRFLFEMATGTGKTLTAAAIIKLFLRTGNTSRVLFLVDRLELEDQAQKAIGELLASDFDTVIYKQNRDDWRRAEIVVTTVQSLLFNNKYRDLFSPTDFDFIISDEAHRSISGNARAVFEFFLGYKLGLTATPRDYLKGVDMSESTVRDPRELERRELLDTYRTFGCENSEPTFRYSLIDGVRDDYLVNPTTIDARTDVSTKLLSEQGFLAIFTDDEGEDRQTAYQKRNFERTFFSESTNRTFCQTFLQNALRDPLNGEIGKSIIFTVSQSHASRITQLLNEMAGQMFPNRYQSDFAVQVTSHVRGAQEFARQFANNSLRGRSSFNPEYRTSKTRVCVTVGMMTTGYDCTDILNIGLFRPIFSPTDFVQIKGRGTRKHDFKDGIIENRDAYHGKHSEKTTFKLFDFFGNCEFFEEEFDYDQVLELPAIRRGSDAGDDQGSDSDSYPIGYEHLGTDRLATLQEEIVGFEGMKVDRMLYYNRFADTVKADDTVRSAVEEEAWDVAIDHVVNEIFDKPEDYFNIEKLNESIDLDRPVKLRELLQYIFGLIPKFKSKDEVLDEEFDKFIADRRLQEEHIDSIPIIKRFFKAYAANQELREIIDSGNFTALTTNPTFTLLDLRGVPDQYRTQVPEYINRYIPQTS